MKTIGKFLLKVIKSKAFRIIFDIFMILFVGYFIFTVTNI